jgi:hypothetical protein
MTFEQFLVNIMQNIQALVVVPQFAVLVVSITEILKNFSPFAGKTKQTMLIAYGALFVVSFAMRVVGYEINWESGLPLLETIVQGVTLLINLFAPPMAEIGATALVAHVGYDFLHDRHVPMFDKPGPGHKSSKASDAAV